MHSCASRSTQSLSPRIVGLGAAIVTVLLLTLGILFGVRKGVPIAIKNEPTYAIATGREADLMSIFETVTSRGDDPAGVGLAA